MHAILPKPMAGIGRKRAPGGQFLIRLIVSRQDGERDVAGTAGAGNLFQAIGPIAPTAEEAQHHQLCVCDDRLDMEIDRHRMAEPEHVGEPQCRRLGRPSRLGCGQASKLGIRGRDIDNVAGRLAEIDGFAIIIGGRLACIE